MKLKIHLRSFFCLYTKHKKLTQNAVSQKCKHTFTWHGPDWHIMDHTKWHKWWYNKMNECKSQSDWWMGNHFTGQGRIRLMTKKLFLIISTHFSLNDSRRRRKHYKSIQKSDNATYVVFSQTLVSIVVYLSSVIEDLNVSHIIFYQEIIARSTKRHNLANCRYSEHELH